MSYMWSFYSFDYDKFNNALMNKRQNIVDGVIKEIKAFNDHRPAEIEKFGRIGTHILKNGLAYDGLPNAGKKIMDSFVFELFRIFAEEINREPESHAFLSPDATSGFPSHFKAKKFFWSRPKPLDEASREYLYLPIFRHFGRRFGEQTPFSCEYVILTNDEVSALGDEIEKFLATSDGAKLNDGFDNSVKEDFLGPVTSAIRKGKSLYAQLS